MSAALSTQAPHATPGAPASSLAAVPRAIWVTLGVLAMATAGLGGALVMRAVDRPDPVSAQVSMQSTPAQVAGFGQQAPEVPAPALAAQQPAVAQAAPVAKPKPVVVQKPVQKPVQQATGSAGAPQVVAQGPVQQPSYTQVQSRPAICASCGTVQYVQEVKEKGPSTGLGAVGGAVLGGLLGHQVGGGNGKKVMAVAGAAGGAYAGHEAEKHIRATTAYDVQVRMEDGSVRNFRRSTPVAVGSRVTVEGGNLHVGGQASAPIPATVAPRTLQTSGQSAFGG